MLTRYEPAGMQNSSPQVESLVMYILRPREREDVENHQWATRVEGTSSGQGRPTFRPRERARKLLDSLSRRLRGSQSHQRGKAAKRQATCSSSFPRACPSSPVSDLSPLGRTCLASAVRWTGTCSLTASSDLLPEDRTPVRRPGRTARTGRASPAARGARPPAAAGPVSGTAARRPACRPRGSRWSSWVPAAARRARPRRRTLRPTPPRPRPRLPRRWCPCSQSWPLQLLGHLEPEHCRVGKRHSLSSMTSPSMAPAA
mmetsp:Transcript_104511/g.305099  ORF Transcript_104511/g.305099 Transcript_104511/m.305099 type:complete len:258 (-) Transcript_104511:135-908(-)